MVGGLEAKGKNTAVTTAFICKRGAVTKTHSRCEGLDLCSSWFMLPFYLLCPSTMVTAPSHKPKAYSDSISSKSSVVAAVAHNEFDGLDIPALLNDAHVIFDVKGKIDKSIVDGRL